MQNVFSFAGLLLSITVTQVLVAGDPKAGAVSQQGPQNPPPIQRMFNAKCTSCHSGQNAQAGLRLDSWDNLFAGSRHGEAIVPYDAGNSLLYEVTTKLVGGPHPEELGAEGFTQGETEIFERWINTGARNQAGEVPHADATQLLYVANQDDAAVSIIDMDAKVVIRQIDLQALGFSPTAKPHHVAVEPGGSYWYVSLIADGKVLKFDRNNELVAQSEFETPGMLAIHPTEDMLYVGRSMAAVNPPMRIGEIVRSDMTIEEIEVFYPRPHAMAFVPTGAYAFTASLAENQIISVDTETQAAEFTAVEGPTHTFVQFAISPDGATLVATTQLTAKVMMFDISEPPTMTLTDTIDVNAAPWHPVFSLDGRFVYVPNKDANTVTVVDMETREVAAVIEGDGLAQPHGAAVAPDGQYLFVSSNNLKEEYTPRRNFGDNSRTGTVVVINTETYEIEKVIEVGRHAAGVGAATGR
jgi:YVTN family beta-propeller protein